MVDQAPSQEAIERLKVYKSESDEESKVGQGDRFLKDCAGGLTPFRIDPLIHFLLLGIGYDIFI